MNIKFNISNTLESKRKKKQNKSLAFKKKNARNNQYLILHEL